MSKRKIFDVTPPEAIKKPEGPESPLLKAKTGLKMVPPHRPTKLSSLTRGLIFSLIFLVILGTSGYILIKPKIEIKIWPKTEEKSFQALTTIATDSSISEDLILGEVFEEESLASQEFSSSGKVVREEKAEGVIRVYNNYSTYSQTLVAATRFLSAEGKLFRVSKKVVVPGGHYEKGKLVSGYLDVEVVADQSGEEYNIGPSTFSIPGFAGTPMYTAFYGKSSEPMTGGFRQEVTVVSKNDLDQAQETLTKKALEDCEKVLRGNVPENFIILDAALQKEVLEISPLAETGQEVEKFFFQVRARAKTLAFKKSDLESFAQKFILSQVGSDKEIYEESLDVKYSTKEVDLKEAKITLNLEISAKIYSAIDEANLKERIKGKTIPQIKEILGEFPQISTFTTHLSPFWAQKSPVDLENIKISLIFTS